jgi:peptide/nickel transport system permease protein
MIKLKLTVKRMMKSKLAVIGSLICLVLIVFAVLGPWLQKYDPLEVNVSSRLKAPSAEHWFGTDELGRDLYSRIISGARITMIVGIVAVLFALVFGTVLGVLAGYYGGVIDTVVSFIVDAVWSFPTIILALAITTALGTGLFNVLLAIGIVFTPNFARIVRSMVLTVKETEYVQGAKAIGLNDLEIIIRYILPNSFSVIIVQTSLNAAQAILAEASLSFMGLGLSAELASWGAMLRGGFTYISRGAYWLSIAPGIAIMLAVMGLNFFGDGLRDALDVRLRMD